MYSPIGSVEFLRLEVDHEMTAELPGPVPDLGALGAGELLLARVLLGHLQRGRLGGPLGVAVQPGLPQC